MTVVNAGGSVSYTIIVRNFGPDAANGATVTDNVPAALTNVTWTCSADPGSSCGAASGAGSINTTVNLANNGRATFTVNATVAANATGSLANTATVAVPAGVVDPNPNNNSATDTDTIALARPNAARARHVRPDGRKQPRRQLEPGGDRYERRHPRQQQPGVCELDGPGDLERRALAPGRPRPLRSPIQP